MVAVHHYGRSCAPPVSRVDENGALFSFLDDPFTGANRGLRRRLPARGNDVTILIYHLIGVTPFILYLLSVPDLLKNRLEFDYEPHICRSLPRADRVRSRFISCSRKSSYGPRLSPFSSMTSI